MRRKTFGRMLRILLALAVSGACGCGSPRDARQDGPIGDLEELAIPTYRPRFGRERPLIAVVAYNPATELTDFVVPYGVLVESEVADVVAVAPSRGPIRMRTALRFQAETTLADLDARHPEGADYVIIPNIYEGEEDEGLLRWIRRQATLGAILVGICDGVPTLANAGVLEGRRATTHWRTIDRLEREHPGTEWIRNRRYLADGNVVTTSGVSASIPVSMALVEAIGGPRVARDVGRRLGISRWGPEHDSEQFRLTPRGFLTALFNQALFWRRRELGLEVRPGVDEIRVALVADAYGRTRRSPVVSVAGTAEPIRTRRGLLLLPERVAGAPDAPDRMVPLMEELRPVQMLDRSLDDIAATYGPSTAEFVALTMEYAWSP